MKKLIYLFIVVFLFSCKKEKEYEFSFQQPAIDNGAENVSLRPLFGPGAGGGTEPDKYTYSYYCDIVNPPEHFIVSTVGRDNIMTPKSEILKPGTKYYWKCVGSYEGQEGSSDVYSFTTISLNSLNTRWGFRYNVLEADYNNRFMHWLSDYKISVDDGYLIGQAMNYTISKDSIKMLKIYLGTNSESEKYDGLFSFGIDTVKIIGLKYDFVNFGEYEDGLTFVLKKFSSDTLFIYTPNS